MELIGLDVGFSSTRPSSGVARLRADGALLVGHAKSTWQARSEVIGTHEAYIAAIDAPFTKARDEDPRSCERVFTLGLFQRRCKPGLSHVKGTGQTLRAAGWETFEQLKSLVPATKLAKDFPRVRPCNVVEAFPNAFLGVCVPDEVYRDIPKLRRGKKFDWLYDQWIERDILERVTEALGVPGFDDLTAAFRENRQHDQRAAIVCLLTAAGVFSGHYAAVGDEADGYFFLPPWQGWATWARDELRRQWPRLPGLKVWIDGDCYHSDRDLPS